MLGLVFLIQIFSLCWEPSSRLRRCRSVKEENTEKNVLISLSLLRRRRVLLTQRSRRWAAAESSMKFIWHEYWIMVKCILVCHGLSTPQRAVYLLLFLFLSPLLDFNNSRTISSNPEKEIPFIYISLYPQYIRSTSSRVGVSAALESFDLVYGMNVNLIQPKKELMEKLCRSIKSHKLT